MNLKKLTLGLLMAALTAPAWAAGPVKPAYSENKKHAALSTRHEAAVVVPAKKAYAWATRDRGNVTLGIVDFNLNEPEKISSVQPMRYSAYAGCFANGKYYFDRYRTVDDSWEHIAFSTVDINTGKVTDIADWSDEYFVINDMAYDYTTNTLYAMGRNFYLDDFLTALQFEYSSLMTINLNTGVVKEIKQYIDWANGALTNPTYYTLACDLNGTLYSVNQNGQLVILDRDNDYEEVVVGSTGINPYKTVQSMEFDHTTGTLYWAADYKNKVSELLVVDTASGHASVVGPLGTDSHLIGLYIPFTLPSQAAPAAASAYSVTPAADGGMSVSLAWTNPTKSFGGQNLASISSVKILRNNTTVATLTGTPGQAMTYTDNAPAVGLYSYSVVAVNSAGEGLPVAQTRWVGKDLPLAVSKLGIGRNDDGMALLEWVEPTEGIHGGILDQASLGYKIVRFPDGVTVATDARGNTFTDTTIPATGRYYYTVESHTAQGVGELATSVEIALGAGISTYPWNTLFADKSEFNLWTVVNVNGGSTWSWKSRTAGGYTAQAMYSYDNNVPGDDYLISPNLYMQAGAKYKVRFAYAGANANYTEKFEVTFGQGKTAEAQSTVLKSYTVKTGDFAFGELELPEVAETGDYNIAFHALSDPKCYNLYITDVTVTQTQAAPVQPGDDPEYTFAAPKDLQYTVNQDGSVLLTWDNSSFVPTPSTGNIFEDFEAMPDWEINPAGTYGWTYVDGDGGIPYVDDWFDKPYPTDGLPLAAMVMNPYELGDYISLPNPAYSGSKYLLFKSNYAAGDNSRPAPVPDDWFISPALNFGRDFIFRFYCKADPDAEGFGDLWNKEQFRVGYSTTDNQPESFVWMTDGNEQVTTNFDEWVKKEYSMPADAKYVCIHYCTPDCGYWFMVDDVFIGVESQAEAAPARAAAAATFRHYEVHLDDKHIASTTESNHTITGLTPGQHVAKVYSVYEEGRSEAAVAAFNISQSGIDAVEAAGIKVYPNPAVSTVYFGTTVAKAQLYNMTGALVAAVSDADCMSVDACPAGTYILVLTTETGSETTKLIVK